MVIVTKGVSRHLANEGRSVTTGLLIVVHPHADDAPGAGHQESGGGPLVLVALEIGHLAGKTQGDPTGVKLGAFEGIGGGDADQVEPQLGSAGFHQLGKS